MNRSERDKAAKYIAGVVHGIVKHPFADDMKICLVRGPAGELRAFAGKDRGDLDVGFETLVSELESMVSPYEMGITDGEDIVAIEARSRKEDAKEP